MKRLKKSRVSWPSDSMLCQVKMFLSEDCPAKVASNSNLLPPGFEATEYATKRPNISHIPRIKWKRPPKYVVDDALLVASGGESTETRVENLRISKVFEAFYPHRSVIPTSPSSVSQAVEDESYDDSKTPNIRLSPVEDNDEQEASALPPSGVSGLGSDLSIVVSAALSALMRTKEQGSLVDADLLVKLLSDPNIVKNLMNEMAGKPLQTANHTLNTNFTRPSVGPPQHVTSSSPMTQSGNGVSHTVPLPVQSTVSVATAQLVSSALSMKPPSVFHTHPLSSGLNPLVRLQDSYTTAPMKPIIVDAVIVSQPKTAPKPQSQSLNICTSSTAWNANKVQESGPTGPNPQIRNGASYPMNIYRDDKVSAKPLMKPSTVDEGVVSQQKTVPKPLNISTSNNWNTNRVPESAQTGPDPQIHNGAYPMNVNSDDQVSAKPPVKSLEYFKNLIREHGGVTQATNESNDCKGIVDNNNNNVKVVKATKFKKPCMYFGRARGCKLGESCLYLHDGSKRLWTADVAAKFPRAKRLKFGT